jgi:poly-gamma-glutamate synthesis protein (capsule biosynthesis protein)
MITSGLAIGLWSWSQLSASGSLTSERNAGPPQVAAAPKPQTIAPGAPSQMTPKLGDTTPAEPAAPVDASVPGDTPLLQDTPQQLVVAWTDELPSAVVALVSQAVISDTGSMTASLGSPNVDAILDLDPTQGQPIYDLYFAAASRFDTIDPSISMQDIRGLWQSTGAADDSEATIYRAVAVLSDTIPSLVQLLGEPGETVQGYASVDEVIDAAWTDTPTLALVPFDRLSPELAVFAVDGENPLENAARFDPDAYPLIARIYAHTAPTNKAAQQFLAAFAERTGGANRNPDHLTVIAMTGVTAMVRQTAFQMDQFGPDWPAKVVGPELAAADITAISNEVPFVPGCQTNTDLNNLVFCSKPEYMAALELVGADIIGLTGNHQNDYGRQDALKSLEIYAEAGLPVYGGGANKEEAFAPLYLEHNGNRLAFLGANSYGPKFAWATDDQPGSAEFDLNIMSATIRNIKAKDKADVVLAELQYQESYDVTPLMDQRQNFRALSQAGADIVTGVQSHVPQAMEFEDGKLILYGLGNLFFDQMWSMSTREGLIVKHTIYEGRHIGTQVLTTMLYDYGQPRWASPEERTRILKRVFGASYWDRRR